MTEQEARRGQILDLILERRCSVAQASELLGVSKRQLWRLLASYRQEGIVALVHGNRGRTPANATPPDIRARVIALAKGAYEGTNDTHLSELLAEREGDRLVPADSPADAAQGRDEEPTPAPCA